MVGMYQLFVYIEINKKSTTCYNVFDRTHNERSGTHK